jgi:dihydrofolate reductase
MKCSAFIATSVDGFISNKDGNIEWLHTAGNGKEIKGENADMGLNDYLSSVDCMIMGRKCMEMISSMNLTPEQWFYGNLKIIVLSNTIKIAPENLKNKIEMYSGNLLKLTSKLESQGYKHAYIDGGSTIQNFINLRLINEITITKAPVLLGSGIPLFGSINKDIKLEKAKAIAFENDFIQVKYKLKYL